MTEAITVQALTVRYPRRPKPVLRDVSFTVPTGRRVLLLGPSGCGKSTLALTLTGLIPHHIFAHVYGTVRVFGHDPQTVGPGRMAVHAGLLLQDPEASFATLMVEDEVAFGLENLATPPAAMPPRIEAALRQVGMWAYRHHALNDLSGGQKQRVALAALLAMHPPLLILDEPTALLDPQGTRAFFRTLAALEGHTWLLIEHKVEAALPLVDEVILLNRDGALLARGAPEPTLRRYLDAALEAGIWLPAYLDPRAAWRATFTTPLRINPPAVRMRGVSFRYHPQGPWILRDIDLTIPQGDFLALLGPNGAGKTTLARLMTHLGLRPTTGQVWLFGDPVEHLPRDEITRRAGFVFQNPEHQFVTERVWDEVAYSLRARGWPEERVRERVDALLERFGLAEWAAMNPFRLSQGQKRRLSVATMLALAPRLLILDEPTFGQGRNTAYALMDHLWRLNQEEGVTIVMITHDQRLTRQYARHVAVLQEGRLAFHGSVDEALERGWLNPTA